MPSTFTKEEQAIIKQRVESGELKISDPEYKQIVVTSHKTDPLLFAQTFLSDHMKIQGTNTLLPSPPFHLELLELYSSNNRVAIAAPRNHAKSTITTLFYVIHSALYKKKMNIVIVSASEDMAVKFLRRIRNELEFNKRILSIFGIQEGNKWTDTEIKLTNGVSIYAKGREAQLRGLIDGANRPDLIILDDVEDDELVRSENRRNDVEEWFNAAVLPSLDPASGQLIIIGTVLHEASLLNRVINHSIYTDFVSKRYAALFEQDGQLTALWPERFSVEALTKIKESYINRDQLPKFYMEYLNNPIPVESAKFKSEFFQYFETLPEPHTDLIYEVYIDLGGGSTKATADYTSMVVIAIDKHNNIFVHDYVNERTGTDTNEILNHMFALFGKYHPHKFIIEKTVATNMLESSLRGDMIRRNIHLNVEYVNPTKGSSDRRGNMSDGKYQRIAAMEAAFKLGVIKIRPWMTELKDQLLSFPRGSHDDLIDALAYGYMLISRRRFQSHQDPDDPFSPRTTSDYEPLYPDIGL